MHEPTISLCSAAAWRSRTAAAQYLHCPTSHANSLYDSLGCFSARDYAFCTDRFTMFALLVKFQNLDYADGPMGLTLAENGYIQ